MMIIIIIMVLAGGLRHPSIRSVEVYRCRANMAHIRQSRPDSGLGFDKKILETF